MKHHSKILNKLETLPGKPGVYQFYDENSTLLYVGKAKNLKRRVASYFTRKKFENGKTAMLVNKIADLKYIVVDTELDALLLENSLVKKLQPRYNVLLRDDKTFPWICIKKERFPRVFPTRTIIHDGSEYFGPYASVKMMNAALELIRKLYKLRNCNYNLSEENINKKNFKICLEYHIGNCLGPCEALDDEAHYNQSIKEIHDIIKGNIGVVALQLKTLMESYSKEYQFEKAQIIKEKLEWLAKFREKSVVVNPKITNADVFSICTDEKYGYVNYMKVVNGVVVMSHSVQMKKVLDETKEELLSIAISGLFPSNESELDALGALDALDALDAFNASVHKSVHKELIVPFAVEVRGFYSKMPIRFLVPQRGDKRKLLELSLSNAMYYRAEKQRIIHKPGANKNPQRILEQLKADLRLKELPVHIECFDNSNIQGAHPVAAMSVFKNGQPAKRDYRHYNIRTVSGPNDFASMEEVVYRRYKSLLEEKKPLPQLIIIDGGKGQLSSAIKSIEQLGLAGEIGIIGIAKKLEEIYYPNDPVPLYLDKKSASLKMVQRLRNEAHRFGIAHHRSKRVKSTITSELLHINGLGIKTASSLLKAFKSVNNIKSASVHRLTDVVGKAKAKKVFDYFNQ